MGKVKIHHDSRVDTVSVYLLNRRGSYVVFSQLCPEFGALLVDRWMQLEDSLKNTQQPSQGPQTTEEWLRFSLQQIEEMEK